MPKRTSMQEIADRLNISKNAVSLALNGKPGVSDQTRDLVIKTAKQLGYSNYEPDNMTSNKIMVIIPEYIRNDSFFYNDIYWAIENRAKQKGYLAIMLTVSTQMEQAKELPSLYYEIKFAGAITIGILSENYMSFLHTQIKNIVSVDHYYFNMNIYSIVTANVEGCFQITKLAIEKGHKDLGFVGSITATASIYDRYCGFVRALLDAGLENHAEYNILTDSPLSELMSNPDDLYRILSAMPRYPTAWICGGDRIAIAMIEALKRLNLRVPEDISVLGFDDLEVSAILDTPLTTVRVERKLMGRLAIDRLIGIINNKSLDIKTCIGTSVIVRSSLKDITDNKSYG